MKKYIKIISILIGFSILGGIVYATVTTASSRKSTKIPWQGVTSTKYDSAHNVGTGYAEQSRFTCYSGTCGTIEKGIVYDSVTKLYWQSSASSEEEVICKTFDTDNYIDINCNDSNVNDSCNFCASKVYCSNLDLLGFSDWRLPNVKEINSIMNFSKTGPSLNSSMFFVDGGVYYNSSTINVNDNSQVLVVSFFNGNAPSLNYGGFKVICVRNDIN